MKKLRSIFALALALLLQACSPFPLSSPFSYSSCNCSTHQPRPLDDAMLHAKSEQSPPSDEHSVNKEILRYQQSSAFRKLVELEKLLKRTQSDLYSIRDDVQLKAYLLNQHLPRISALMRDGSLKEIDKCEHMIDAMLTLAQTLLHKLSDCRGNLTWFTNHAVMYLDEKCRELPK